MLKTRRNFPLTGRNGDENRHHPFKSRNIHTICGWFALLLCISSPPLWFQSPEQSTFNTTSVCWSLNDTSCSCASAARSLTLGWRPHCRSLSTRFTFRERRLSFQSCWCERQCWLFCQHVYTRKYWMQDETCTEDIWKPFFVSSKSSK